MMNSFYGHASSMEGSPFAPTLAPVPAQTSSSSSNPTGILHAGEIARSIHAKSIQLVPYRECALQPFSYDISLGTHIFRAKSENKVILFGEVSSCRLWNNYPTAANTLKSLVMAGDVGWLQTDAEEFDDKESAFSLDVGESVLAYSSEFVVLGQGICAFVQPRTSVSRLRLRVEGGFLQSGFAGRVSLVLTNDTGSRLIVPTGRRIAQLVFQKTVGQDSSYPANQSSHYTETTTTTARDAAGISKIWKPELILPATSLHKEVKELPPFFSVNSKGERVVDPETANKLPEMYYKGKYVGPVSHVPDKPEPKMQGVRKEAPKTRTMPADLLPQKVKKETVSLPFVAKYDPNVPPE